jgi:hypothetical protein
MELFCLFIGLGMPSDKVYKSVASAGYTVCTSIHAERAFSNGCHAAEVADAASKAGAAAVVAESWTPQALNEFFVQNEESWVNNDPSEVAVLWDGVIVGRL